MGKARRKAGKQGKMQIVRLVPQETASLDPSVIQELARHHGLDCAEDVVCTSLAELTRHLRRLDDDYRSADPHQLGRRVRAVVTLADQLGMRHVARVAADVVRCSHSGDEAALAATLSRLMRLLGRALDDVSVEPSAF